MKKNYDRRQFVKLATKVAITTSLFPACSTSKKKDFSFRKISSDSNEFDYIVVGSGAGGAPVVARLVEAGFRVLLIEAGTDKTNQNIEVPAFHGLSTEDPLFSWEFFVNHYENRAKQLYNPKYDHLNKGIFYPRATGLGGCTIHNAMILMYPDNSDWEHIQNLTGDRSWNPRAMRKYFQRFEDNQYYKPPHKSRSIMTMLNREKMGFKGWLKTEQTSPGILLRDKKFLKVFFSALKEEGLLNEIADILGPHKNLKLDPNTWSYVQNKLDGVFNVPKATYNGKRTSTRDLILNIKRLYPELLTIKTNTLAHKVVLDENKKAIGIEAFEGKNLYKACPRYAGETGVKKYYKCSKEVILSGGVYNSPQLLMLSGIGDRNHLSKHGIETIVNLPGVGKNLQDRYEITVTTELKNDFKLLEDCKFGLPGDKCLEDYKNDPIKSVYQTNGVIAGIIKRSRPNLKDPDLFIFGLPGYFKGYYKGWSRDTLQPNYLTWAILKGHNKNQSGFLKLKSNSPYDRPEINFRYFEESAESFSKDLESMNYGVNLARNINKRMSKYIKQEVYPGKYIHNVKEWITNESWGHHASCTNKIGSDNDAMAVLDSKFQVRGTKGLRVVDASSFNKVPGLFIVVPIFMIAEKAAEDILDSSSSY